ncbi:hypothetical protein Bca52824_031241 [Brassica carinata]|uniref:RRM domain-containing protein n=1 Tax=Brassica carinata TaxID=52824 RepID=A0A8X7SBU2_BRACI|nr:hypothetical protein Bca52824_031241 [Brassica carinata]
MVLVDRNDDKAVQLCYKRTSTICVGSQPAYVSLRHFYLEKVSSRSRDKYSEEASNAMALDGIILEGVPVKVKRPTDYNPSLAAALGRSQPNPNLNLAAVGVSSVPAGGLEGPDRIFVGGLPYYLTEDQIRELLESFGPLRGFNLDSVTDIACAALNGIKMDNILLHAQQQIALQRLMLQPGGTPTKIVCLTQVVSADDLGDDEEYEDIMADMRQEGGKFGNLVNVVIPRPHPDHDPTPGVGKFGGNQVVAVYYPENKYAQGDYQG